MQHDQGFRQTPSLMCATVSLLPSARTETRLAICPTFGPRPKTMAAQIDKPALTVVTFLLHLKLWTVDGLGREHINTPWKVAQGSPSRKRQGRGAGPCAVVVALDIVALAVFALLAVALVSLRWCRCAGFAALVSSQWCRRAGCCRVSLPSLREDLPTTQHSYDT